MGLRSRETTHTTIQTKLVSFQKTVQEPKGLLQSGPIVQVQMDDLSNKNVYAFTDDDIEVLKNALSMYYSYRLEYGSPMLAGDEHPDSRERVCRTDEDAGKLAREFYEAHVGESFEEIRRKNDRDMPDRAPELTWHDVSEFDFEE